MDRLHKFLIFICAICQLIYCFLRKIEPIRLSKQSIPNATQKEISGAENKLTAIQFHNSISIPVSIAENITARRIALTRTITNFFIIPFLFSVFKSLSALLLHYYYSTFCAICQEFFKNFFNFFLPTLLVDKAKTAKFDS